MHIGKIDRWAGADLSRGREDRARVASGFHQLARGSETEECRACFGAQVTTDLMMLLNECFPKFVVILGNQIEWSRKTEIMAIVCKQLHAKAVDGAEESSIECDLNFR